MYDITKPWIVNKKSIIYFLRKYRKKLFANQKTVLGFIKYFHMDSSFKNEPGLRDIKIQAKYCIKPFIKRFCHLNGLKCQEREYDDKKHDLVKVSI